MGCCVRLKTSSVSDRDRELLAGKRAGLRARKEEVGNEDVALRSRMFRGRPMHGHDAWVKVTLVDDMTNLKRGQRFI